MPSHKLPFGIKERRIERNEHHGFVRQLKPESKNKGYIGARTPQLEGRAYLLKPFGEGIKYNPHANQAIRSAFGRWFGLRANDIFSIGYGFDINTNKVNPNVVIVQTHINGMNFYYTFNRNVIPEGIKTALRILERY